MKSPSILVFIRDVILLPFSATVIIPWLLADSPWMVHVPMAIRVASILLLTGGFGLFLWTIILFRRFGKGTLAPWTPTQQLIIKGPYRYCRNPMITGVLTILIAEFGITGNLYLAIWSILFFLVNAIYFPLVEEPLLISRFGPAYRRYMQKVPRWIPHRKPYAEG